MQDRAHISITRSLAGALVALLLGCSIANATDAVTSTAIGSLTLYANSIEAVHIDSSGHVGIGTTAPGYALDVNGAAHVTGILTADNGLRSTQEIIGTSISGYGQVRMIGGSYGAFWRNDGGNTYLLLTASGDQYGAWNGLRPFYVNDATGAVTMQNGLSVNALTVNGTAITGNGGLTDTLEETNSATGGSDGSTVTVTTTCPAGYRITGCSGTCTPNFSTQSASNSCTSAGIGYSCVATVGLFCGK